MLEIATRPSGAVWGPGRYRLVVVEVAFADSREPLAAAWPSRMVAEMDAYYREVSGGALRWVYAGMRRIHLAKPSAAFHLTRRSLADRARFWKHLLARLRAVPADALLGVIPEAAAVRGCFAVGPRWNSPRLDGTLQPLGATFTRGAIVRASTVWGTIAHELGHVIGLPDLYDYATGRKTAHFSASRYVGPWDLMGRAPEEAGGARAHPMAWTKALAGWIVPVEWTPARRRYVVGPGVDAAAVRAPTGDGAWLFVEGRTHSGFDTVLPTEGVLVSVADERRREGRGPLRILQPRQGRDGTDARPKWYAALQVGESLRRAGYTVAVIARTAEGFEVEINRLRRSAGSSS